jgi:tRNA threonylcarbamoyladenosine biosynthesis protein TsaE
MTDTPTQWTVTTADDTETRALGERLGRLLGPNDVVCLQGELGAGKTTLAQGIAAGLGVDEPVSSPTFALVQQYEGRLPVYHLDVYRLASLDELIDLGFPELWRAGAVLLIEWPERIAAALPKERIEVAIEVVGAPESEMATRRLVVTAHGERAHRLIEALHAGGSALTPSPSPNAGRGEPVASPDSPSPSIGRGGRGVRADPLPTDRG